ncbi:MAG: hypothetical protein WC211_03660 [Dehalococcoidia bacterium]
MTMPGSPRTSDSPFRLGGIRLKLADQESLGKVGADRSWDVKRVKRQAGDPEPEFHLPMSTFNQGYGYSFLMNPGVYETANQWDLSAFGKARTWARFATSESITEGTRKGWIYFHVATGFLYVLRGRYAAKYRFTGDDGAEWPLVEIHDFGDDRAVAGRWSEFNGNLYVPLINTSTEAEARFHELSAVNEPTAEVQTLTESGSPTGGTFTVTFNSGYNAQTTSALAFDITAADMQTALRLLPGLQNVTVGRTGTTTDFVWTVTLTAAPTADGTTSPPALTVDDAGLTGGGAPAIAVATFASGTGDEWTLGPSGVVARYFTEWNKPGVGPVLARCYENNVSLCAGSPMTSGDWGAAYPCGSSTYRINAITTLDRYLVVGKQDTLGTLDEEGVFVPKITSIQGVVSDDNFVGMMEHNAYLYAPHKLGLIRYKLGGSYSFVGAEQDGALEADLEESAGHGAPVALAPFGKTLYGVIEDDHAHAEHPVHSVIVSLQEPGSDARGPLTPHMHFNIHAKPEDIITASLTGQPRLVLMDAAVSDNGVGTAAWTTPENAIVDDTATADSAGTAATSERLLLTAAAAATYIPPLATIVGVRWSVRRRANLLPAPGVVADASVKLVIGGAVTGAERAEAGSWGTTAATVVYGTSIDMHGLALTPASFNAGDFGVAIQATITSGTAHVEYVGDFEVFYTLPGSGERSSVLIELHSDDETQETATLYGYRLPADGLTASSDPRVEHAVSDAVIRLSREFRPNRNVQKTWRSIEFYVDMSPSSGTVGFEMWASINDGAAFALLDENGDTLNVQASGTYEAFLPADAVASGLWIQPLPTIPAITGALLPVSVTLRDIILHGAWTSKMTDEVRAIVVLDKASTSDAMAGSTGTPMRVLRALRALAGPRDAGALPITMHDPEIGEDTRCIVTEFSYRRVRFTGGVEPYYIVFLTLRKAPYGAE